MLGLSARLPAADGKGHDSGLWQKVMSHRGGLSFDTGSMVLAEGDYFQTMETPSVVLAAFFKDRQVRRTTRRQLLIEDSLSNPGLGAQSYWRAPHIWCTQRHRPAIGGSCKLMT